MTIREQPHTCGKVFLVKFGDFDSTRKGSNNVLVKLGDIGFCAFALHDYSTWRQDFQKIQTLLEDISNTLRKTTKYVQGMISRCIASDGFTEFKKYVTLHVIGNPNLSSARDLNSPVTQYTNVNGLLRRDLKAGEVQANAVHHLNAHIL